MGWYIGGTVHRRTEPDRTQVGAHTGGNVQVGGTELVGETELISGSIDIGLTEHRRDRTNLGPFICVGLYIGGTMQR